MGVKGDSLLGGSEPWALTRRTAVGVTKTNAEAAVGEYAGN